MVFQNHIDQEKTMLKLNSELHKINNICIVLMSDKLLSYTW